MDLFSMSEKLSRTFIVYSDVNFFSLGGLFLPTHLQCCPVLYPSEICKYVALLSAILCLFKASCHCNVASIVNWALRLCKVKSICYCVRLNVPKPSLNRIILHGPTSFWCVCVLFLIPQWFQCPPSHSNTHNSLPGKDALIVINISVFIYFASWHSS